MWELIKYIYEQIQLQDKQLDGSFWSTSEHGRRDHSMPSPIPIGASLVAQTIKNLFVTQETGVRSLGQEDPLEKEMATHSSILAWRLPWIEEVLVGYSPWGCKESDTAEQLTLHFLPISPYMNNNLYSAVLYSKWLK